MNDNMVEKMTENEFILEDRIAKIRSINDQMDLINNSFIAFSGGKDSVILSKLIDLALPNNKIPRLFLNTGMEYCALVKYVKKQSKQDDRIIILNSKINIKQMLMKYGYPFKSKSHAHALSIYQHGGLSRCVRVYLGTDVTNQGKKGFNKCPKNLMYNFTPDFKLKCSDKCCIKLKKEPSMKWAKENNKTITITGMRRDEGGSRVVLSCLSKNNTHFNPLVIISDDWENWFTSTYNIELCALYYAPYNFKRTGCKGCPFTLNLQHDLDIMEQWLPNEYKQCNILWKPVYDEYRKIGYRLRGEN